MLSSEASSSEVSSLYVARSNSQGEGPYDCRSVMHYGGFVGIPPSVPAEEGGPEGWLSAGDVAGVNRLYGQPSEATVVTTNPPGLGIVVDGRRVATPATFHWPAGSVHVLEAPLWQMGLKWVANGVDLGRFMFARWSDGGDRAHSFTARPGETWIEASFLMQRNHLLDPDFVVYEDRFEGFDATPRALTFISDPATAQEALVIRLTNRGDVAEQYTMVSNRPWLLASPRELSLAPAGSADIEVRATRGNLGPELHRGGLRIRPAGLNATEAAKLPGIPVAFVVLPEMVSVTLGKSGETAEVAAAATEGFVRKDGRPVGREGRVISSNGDAYVLAEGPGGIITATFEPRSQTLDLPGGGQVTLTQRGEGEWRIGGDPVGNGQRHAAGGHEYVLELVDGRWSTAAYALRSARPPPPTPAPAPALEAALSAPYGLAIDGEGSVYVAETYGFGLWKVDVAGFITRVAGTGERDYGGDRGPATEAQFGPLTGVAVDAAGNVYVADRDNNRVRKIGWAGTVTTLAGTGERGYGRDDGPAAQARFASPAGVAVDAAGNVYVADTGNHRVRKIGAAGTVTTLAGTGERGYGGDDGPAAQARFALPAGVAVDAAGNVYVADTGNHRVRKIGAAGTVTTLAGTGERGYGGDDGPATEARFAFPAGVAVDAAGNVYVADTGNHRVRKIGAAGTITTLAGTGERGYGGDDGPATEARFAFPAGVAVDAAGNVYVADTGNHRVRKIGAAGTITTLAGTGERGYGGDDGPATEARFALPAGVAVDAAGNVYVADTGNHRVRKIGAAGTITTLAGTGERGYGGDDGPAAQARFALPAGVAVDAAGNVYVADTGNHRVRKIGAAGTVTTLAGTGERGYGGDDGPATEARFAFPAGVAVDAAGNVYVLEQRGDSRYDNRVRRISPDGTISTVVGHESGWSLREMKDGLPAAEAGLNELVGMAVDAEGNTYVAEWSVAGGSLVRKVDLAGTLATVGRVPGEVTSLAAGRPGELFASGDTWELDPNPGGRIWRLDLRAGRVEVVSRLRVDAIASDPSGNLWFASGRRVRVLERLPLPSEVTVRLPGGGGIRLAKRDNGNGWRLGDEEVESGHRYVHGEAEHVLAQADGRWRVVRMMVPLGTAGHSAQIEVLADGSLVHGPSARPLGDGSLLTGQDFNTYRLRVGPGGTAADLVPAEEQRVAQEGGGALRLTQGVDGMWRTGGARVESGQTVVRDGWAYRLEFGQGQWVAARWPAYSIRTVVGSSAVAEGVPAVDAILRRPTGIAIDAVGNVFVADTEDHRIRMVDVAGVIRTVAGSGAAGYSGDDGPATAARLRSPIGVAADALGNVYVADSGNHRVRRIDGEGTIVTLAGTGVAGFWGNGGPAVEARLYSPQGLAVDLSGNVYVAESHRGLVRKIDRSGIINTIAGGGSNYFEDGVPAVEAGFWTAVAVAVDSSGNVYVADSDKGWVRKIDRSGTINTMAGGGSNHYEDGGPAVEARLYSLQGLAADTAGNLYVAESSFFGVGKIDPSGTINTIAGRGSNLGDGGPAVEARLYSPHGVAVDTAGNVYVTESDGHRVRKIDAAGTISTLAGTGQGTSGGGVASRARLDSPASLAVDGAGTLFFTDAGRVWKLNASGVVTVFAGTGESGFGGDGGPASEAQLRDPRGVAVDAAGNVYVGERARVRKIDATGTITTLAGTGLEGERGDGGPATEARLDTPKGVAADAAGNVYVALYGFVRRIDVAGTITTLAGGGARMNRFGGEGGPATEASLGSLEAVAVDGAGNVYVVDSSYKRVLRIDAVTGTISTISQGRAIAAVAADGDGNVYVGDGNRIRRIDADGSVWMIAGTGEAGFGGNRQLAVEAELSVSGLAVDRFGSVWFTDPLNHRVRVLDPSH